VRQLIARTLRTKQGEKRRTRKPSFECLEERAVPAGLGISLPPPPGGMPAADLWITDAYLVNNAGDRIDSPAAGELVHVKAEFKGVAIPKGRMTLAATVDGVTQTFQFTFDKNYPDGSWWAHWGTFGFRPGSHNVHVAIDANNDYHDLNPNDDARDFTVTPDESVPQFLIPLAGRPHADWEFLNYVDLDPTSDGHMDTHRADYRGGNYTYDGHTGLDLMLPTFAAMDAGIPVYAAARGTVVDSDEGHFDRSTSMNNTLPVNFVEIDHGGGWQTFYFHLRQDALPFHKGDTVEAGQQIGWAGSSGDSTGPHLHFEVHHNGDLVETFLDPDRYWSLPQNDPAFRTYAGDLPGHVLDQGLSASNPEALLKNSAWPAPPAGIHAGDPLYAWAVLATVHPGDTITFVWHRPDGSAFGAPWTWVAPTDGTDPGLRLGHLESAVTLPADADTGA
jgi:murein DD-endopeptidase MepM/ murein hydrolase activator NlpD